MTITEMRQKVAGLAKQAREILDSAKTENRALASEEREKYDKLMADIRDLGETIQREEKQQELEARLSQSQGGPGLQAGNRQDGGNENGNSEFRNFGDFVNAVRNNEERALSMGVGESGGILVPNQYSQVIRQMDPEAAIVRPRATVIPAGDPPDAKITFPALDQGSNGIYAGVVVKWIGEGGEKPETEPKLDEFGLEPKEVAAHTVVTDKLLRNSDAASALLEKLLRGAITSTEDYAFLRGDGVGKPLGISKSPCRLTVKRNTSSDIKFIDATTMLSLLLPESWGSAVWLASQTALPKLAGMEDSHGNNMFMAGDATKKIPASLLGIPIRFTGKMPALGSEGDLCLCDFSYYLIKDGSGPYVAASEHVYFKQNKTVIKAFWNVDGQAWMKEPLTLEDGSTQVSPFVFLK